MKHCILASMFLAGAVSAPASIITFELIGQGGPGLLPSNELSLANPSTASGDLFGSGITLDTDTNLFTVNVQWGSGNGYGDLNAAATAAHIHGPADMVTNAGVVSGSGGALNFDTLIEFTFDMSATAGSITGSVDLDTLGIGTSDLLAGMWYLNVHTASSNPGGEIRGNLVVVPEPSSLTLIFGGGAVLGLMLRRRRS